MTNAIRHSHAQTLTLQLLFELTAIHLRIMDDGEGFGPGDDRVTGFGIIGMQERAANLGGQFYLVSQPGQGTEITVTVPIGE
jgi:signal transduction histidine kinase